MPRNTSITLDDHSTQFIDRLIEQGRYACYASASEVIRAGLRLLEEEEATLEALRAALIEGEQSGPAQPFDLESFLAERRQRAAPP